MTAQPEHLLNRVPRATYRLQLRGDFGFKEVSQLIDYLEDLGISDLYLSPLFRARKESSHGYDVVDHSTMEPDFGDHADFQAMAQAVRSRDMGLLLDVVPNHVGVNDPGNMWWHDVLEHGELSRYAKNFDIDWERPAENLRGKVLLPVLGDHFGHELEQGNLRVGYHAGRFYLNYHANRFPLSIDTLPAILKLVAEQVDDADAVRQLYSMAGQLQELPSRAERSDIAIEERQKTQAWVTQQLRELQAEWPDFEAAVKRAIRELNGKPDEPRSFDELENLLNQQWYRLANWRAAADEINYRRFFDINDLAAIRVEDPDVFAAVHALADKLLRDELITGLRIDHPDGLLNPSKYFDDLQRMFQQHAATSESTTSLQLFVVAEKILTGEEPLPTSWKVSGTTGYEFLNDVNRLLVTREGLEWLRRDYEALTDVDESAQLVVYESKKQILAESMSSELHMLARRLHRLTQRKRMSRDFTLTALLRALGEVIACFPVYRTYVPPHGWDVDDGDYRRITTAVRWAKVRNPTMDWTTLDFIASVLLLQFPRADEDDREEFRDFVLRFQQVTGPVTAKGIEDTAFYRYYPLAALNEVGGELDGVAYAPEEFHRRMQHRGADWPHGLSATATHDTKRGEDVRARLLVLSEIPKKWHGTVRTWQFLNHPLRRNLRDTQVPNRNEEYLLYQTLVGTWPGMFSTDSDLDEYRSRITDYMQKALREAKLNTSWANPIDEYETAVLDFIRDLLNPRRSAQFVEELTAFVAMIADAGYINSLAQTVLKATAPGVPDFYQGCELWDFNLVDPDNRRPVEYDERGAWLADLKRQFAEDISHLQQSLLGGWPHPRIKLFITWRLLQTRAHLPELFQFGEYVPLTVSGNRADHLLAFARRHEGKWSLTAVPLHVLHILQGVSAGAAPKVDWQNTIIELPTDAPRRWQSAFSHDVIDAEPVNEHLALAANNILSTLPVAVMHSTK